MCLCIRGLLASVKVMFFPIPLKNPMLPICVHNLHFLPSVILIWTLVII